MVIKLKEKLAQIQKDALSALSNISDAQTLNFFEIKYLGRKGELAKILKLIKDLAVAERSEVGKVGNEVKLIIQKALQTKKESLTKKQQPIDLDLTLPGTGPEIGHLHLVSCAIREIERIFLGLGFVRRRYPEVETDYYAFESLNMPPDHPARDEWETFFIKPDQQNSLEEEQLKIVLTPHTSSGQVREMRNHPLPIRMMNISKCYRRQIDLSHTPMFHQFEGLVVDSGIQFVHLKGVLEYFCREFFGSKRKIRLRPFHFRFTEPSFEVDVTCGLCGGKGCRYCKEGWSELGGAGMVHPSVLKAGGLDPNEVTGFAFGWGVERSYLMKEGLLIPDLRMLYKNDLRFLKLF